MVYFVMSTMEKQTISFPRTGYENSNTKEIRCTGKKLAGSQGRQSHSPELDIPEGHALPLNSRRVAASQLRALAGALEPSTKDRLTT